MELQITYEGWFQCRLATDRDAYDETRGRFGWTFAFADEPDLDRIIRFHDPVAPRSHAPDVGVFVSAVAVDGNPVAAPDLVGAQVHLLDGAVFEGRNGDIAVSAEEPVAPWHIQVRTEDGLRLQREDPLDLGDASDIFRRQPVGMSSNDAELIAATGIADPAAFRIARRVALQGDLAQATDPALRAQLEGRIRELEKTEGGSGPQLGTMVFRLDYEHELTGAAIVADPQGVLPGTPDATMPWRIRHFMGGWDADTLCAFTRGTLLVPLS